MFLSSLFLLPLITSASVVDLTDSTFESQVMKSTDPWLIKFYAPWCGHCKKLEPVFKQLGDDASLGTAKVGRVDCTVHKETCGKFGVKGYPTLKVIQNGKYFDYKGARGLKELKAFLTKEHVAAEGTDVGKAAVEEKKPAAAASGGASKVVVLTDANFDELVVKSDKQWLVKFYAPWCGHCKKLIPAYDEVSSDATLGNAAVGKIDCTVHKAVCGQFGVRGYPTLKVIKDGKFYDFKGARTTAGLKASILTNYPVAEGTAIGATPKAEEKKEEVVASGDSKVTILTDDNFASLVQGGSDGWMLKFYAPWCGHCKKMGPDWEKLGSHFDASAEKVKVGKVDCTQHKDICSTFGVKGYPTVFYFKDGKHYKHQTARSLEAFKAFASGGYTDAKETGTLSAPVGGTAYVKMVWKWMSENTALAAAAGIMLLAAVVAILVALLDCCMGEEAAATPAKTKKAGKKSKKDD